MKQWVDDDDGWWGEGLNGRGIGEDDREEGALPLS